MSEGYTRVLEKHGYTDWITVVDSKTLKSPEIIYEFGFRIDGRAAIFYYLTRVNSVEDIGYHKNPEYLPERISEEIVKHYPELQPIKGWEEYETPQCGICESDLIYNDSEEEYFCPWCEEES